MASTGSSKSDYDYIKNFRVFMKHPHRWIAFLIALFAGAVAGVVCFYTFVQIGMRTGVIAMSSWAPAWWAGTFIVLTPLATFGGAAAAAFASTRWYRTRQTPR